MGGGAVKGEEQGKNSFADGTSEMIWSGLAVSQAGK